MTRMLGCSFAVFTFPIVSYSLWIAFTNESKQQKICLNAKCTP